jgi:hypothetical protein
MERYLSITARILPAVQNRNQEFRIFTWLVFQLVHIGQDNWMLVATQCSLTINDWFSDFVRVEATKIELQHLVTERGVNVHITYSYRAVASSGVSTQENCSVLLP